MGAFVFLMVMLMTTLTGIMKQGTEVYNKSVQQKLITGREIGRETYKQANELAKAQALYVKVYGVEPSSIDELISKGFLRSNFKDTKFSKGIVLDENKTIQVTSKNAISQHYNDALKSSIEAKKNKSLTKSNDLYKTEDIDFDELMNNL